MKKFKKISIPHSLGIKNYSAMLLFLILLFPLHIFSQADSTQADSTAIENTTEPKEGDLISPGINFTCTQKISVIILNAAVTAKVNGTLKKLEGRKIHFFSGSDSGFKKTGEAVTNKNGLAIFELKPELFQVSKDGKLHFKASFEGDKSFESAEEEVTLKRGRLEITPVQVDSLLTLQLKLVDISTGTETGIPATDLIILVKRMFYPMKIGEGKTDDSGLATIEVPHNLPGDESGKITLLARLEDNEIYGNIEAEITQSWGIPVSNLIIEQPRALWSSHPPMWMVITFIVLMTTVWGHFFFIIYELVRLKKEHE